MQTGGELKLESCPSSFSSSSSSSSSPVFSVLPRTTVNFSGEGIMVGVGDWKVGGEKQLGPATLTGNGGLISLPMAAASSATSVNFTQSVKVGAGETIDVEQVVHVNTRFTMPAPLALQSQPGCVLRDSPFNHDGGSELSPLFPAVTNSFKPEPLNAPFGFPSSLKDNAGFPGGAIPNFKRKLEVVSNPYNSGSLPLHTGPLSPKMAGSLGYDSVFQSSSVAVPALYQQQPLFPAAGRHSSMNCSVAESPKLGVVTNQEMNTSSTSQDLKKSGTLGMTCPIPKRKAVHQRQTNNLSLSVLPNGSRSVNFGSSLLNQGSQPCSCNSSQPIPSLRQSSIPPSLIFRPVYLNVVNFYKQDKELEGNGLAVILQKELRNSDVSNLGRIILPKKEAEANLPPLFEKEGMYLFMEDIVPPFTWEFKFRFWPNNKSRMYVMENTGDFVKTHALQTGDFFIIYKANAPAKYIVRGMKSPKLLVSTNQVEPNCNLEEGSSSKQHPRSDKVTEARNQKSMEHGQISAPTSKDLIPKIENDASPMCFPYYLEKECGGPSHFPPPLPDFDPDMINYDRFLP